MKIKKILNEFACYENRRHVLLLLMLVYFQGRKTHCKEIKERKNVSKRGRH